MSARIIIGDALAELRKLPDESVHCAVTSPNDGQFKPSQHAEMARRRIEADAGMFAQLDAAE